MISPDVPSREQYQDQKQLSICNRTTHDEKYPYLSDIRNQVVFEFWRRFQQMIEAQWMPETSTDGTEEQNKIYKKVAHTIGSRMLDPRDSERLNALLIWSHYIKLILYVKKNIHSIELNKDMNILNSYCGSWLYTYNIKVCKN